MKQFLKKKQWVTVALVGALGLAVYLNYFLTTDPALSAGTDVSAPQEDEGEHLGDATFVGAGVSDPEEGSSDGSAADTAPQNYFDKARDNRTAAREEALSILQEVLDNAGASAEDKKTATAAAAAIAENVLQESKIENLIVAKGFPDTVVHIDGDTCSVVVQAEALQQQESLQIMEIVVSQSAVAADKVQILASAA